MKRTFFLLALCFASFPASALTVNSATEKEILLGGKLVITGTVVDLSRVTMEDGFPYAELNVRVDKVSGAPRKAKDKDVQVGKALAVWVGINTTALLFDGQKTFRAAPDTKVDINLDYTRAGPSQDAIRAMVVGKQFLFSFDSIWNGKRNVAAIWPLWTDGWVRACWAGKPCSDSATASSDHQPQ